MNYSLSIVVLSCDKYQDVWQPFAQSFEKFWPDCPYKIYLCTECLAFDHPVIKNIRLNKRLPWGAMLREVLTRIETPYILYLQEDYILKGQVNTEKIIEYFNLFDDRNVGYLRLVPLPPPNKPFNDHKDLGIISRDQPYRTSLQAAIWEKKLFLDIVNPDENGWEFEKKSLERVFKSDKLFLSVIPNSDNPNTNHHKYPLDYYSTAILQGKWQKEGVKILRKAGISISTKQRGILTRWDFFFYHQKKQKNKWYFNILALIDKIISSGKSRHF